MITTYFAEVSSPWGGCPVVVQSSWLNGLEAAIDRAFGIVCDDQGRELGLLDMASQPSRPDR